MKHKNQPWIFGILAILFASCLALTANGQTLADAAREARMNKPATKASPAHVYTNESMNLRPAPAINTDAKIIKSDKTADATADTEKDTAEGSEGGSPEEKKAKVLADLKTKIDTTKAEVETLKREIDIMQREDKLRVAQFYADAGNRLRNEKQYAEDTRNNQAKLAEKQQKLAAATSKLEQARNDARRAGMPAGLIP